MKARFHLRNFFMLVIASVFLLLLTTPAKTHANVNNFIINNFEVDYYLSADDPQGTLEVKEQITVNFSANNHGILRAIPKSYQGNSLKLEILSVKHNDGGSGGQYSTSTENDNLVLKIGDPDRTVTGEQYYEIRYRMQNVIRFYEDHDEFYWDVNGDQWQQHFQNVTARLHLSEGLEPDGQLACYTGRYGATGQNCSIELQDRTVTVQSSQMLIARENMSMVVGFEKQFFTPETLREKIQDRLAALVVGIGMPLIAGGYSIRRWWKHGRDPKGRSTIVPEYAAPDGLLPAEVGTIADFRADQRDITATIIDLAVRGYIKIIETKKARRLLKDELVYTFELVNNDYSSLSDYEKTLIEEMFKKPGNKVGSKVKVADLKSNYYTSVTKAQKQISSRLVAGGYFVSSPGEAGIRLWILLAVVFIMMIILPAFFGLIAFIGIAITAIIVLVAAISMPARTAKGVKAREHALGLKMYLETAEKDRITMMQSPNAAYANTAEPSRTVDLYEKLLPYAIVFGVEKQWSEQFKDMYKTEPAWFNGSGTTAFNSVYLANALSGGMGSAMATAFSPPSSSSGSGFSGGFSGGGGGGGGGGGW